MSSEYWFKWVDGKKYRADTLVAIRKKAYSLLEPEFNSVPIYHGDNRVGYVMLRFHPKRIIPWAGAVVWKGNGYRFNRILNKDGTVRRIE